MSFKRTQTCLVRFLIAAPLMVALLPAQAEKSAGGEGQTGSAETRTSSGSNSNPGGRTISAELAPLLDKAYRQINSLQYDAALKTLNLAVKVDPQSISAKRYLAFALVKNGNPREAIIELKKITREIKPTYFEWCTFGEAYLKSGSLDQAETCYKQALKKTPRNDYARSGLIRVDLKAGNYEQAMASAAEGMKASRGKLAYDYYKNLYISAFRLANIGKQPAALPAPVQPVASETPKVQPSVSRPDDNEELLRHVRESQRRGSASPGG